MIAEAKDIQQNLMNLNTVDGGSHRIGMASTGTTGLLQGSADWQSSYSTLHGSSILPLQHHLHATRFSHVAIVNRVHQAYTEDIYRTGLHRGVYSQLAHLANGQQLSPRLAYSRTFIHFIRLNRPPNRSCSSTGFHATLLSIQDGFFCSYRLHSLPSILACR